ncbi:hypothetical protein PVAND_017789 [Polypedilum vanderplanki]|uniref:Uncharacterized protein n=1 Tax=Polypedilum vanderplanki TaxID=319348 RepID=A0A9J6B905_POLVA|nr:hypothetical protein PVAND_017789 [Polypedilum vanderplanki]
MRRMNNDTFNELDNLEIATEAMKKSEQSPPPIPPRTSSYVPGETRPPSDSFKKQGQLLPQIPISDPSESTSSSSSDTSDSIEDISEDSSENDDDTSQLTSDNNVTANNNNINASSELRHRNRTARQEAMQEKIREIKRKQKESERSLPKKTQTSDDYYTG